MGPHIITHCFSPSTVSKTEKLKSNTEFQILICIILSSRYWLKLLLHPRTFSHRQEIKTGFSNVPTRSNFRLIPTEFSIYITEIYLVLTFIFISRKTQSWNPDTLPIGPLHTVKTNDLIDAEGWTFTRSECKVLGNHQTEIGTNLWISPLVVCAVVVLQRVLTSHAHEDHSPICLPAPWWNHGVSVDMVHTVDVLQIFTYIQHIHNPS